MVVLVKKEPPNKGHLRTLGSGDLRCPLIRGFTVIKVWRHGLFYTG